MDFGGSYSLFAVVPVAGLPVGRPIFQTYLFMVVMVMLVLWFFLLAWSFARLHNHHPSVYDKIGAPSLFWNNSPRSNSMFLEYLYSDEWRALEDPELSIVFWVMRFVFVAFVASLLIVLGSFFIPA